MKIGRAFASVLLGVLNIMEILASTNRFIDGNTMFAFELHPHLAADSNQNFVYSPLSYLAFIEVDEKGTEAAAATIIGFQTLGQS